jgi:hypothetical protein
MAGSLLVACSPGKKEATKSIEFTRIPQADIAGRQKNEIIEGFVKGGAPGERIVLYAKDRTWWIQPLSKRPFTPIGRASKWTNATHLGTDYAALLVAPGYVPSLSLDELPKPGGSVAAVATVKGASSPPSAYLRFSGYEWRVRAAPSARGGNNQYDPRNAWTDAQGALHLKISKSSGIWKCAELSLTRSLGYGTYSFDVRDTSHMEPSAALDLFTYDYSGADENYGEMNIEISKWGDPASKNAQYVIQPWYLAANVARFSAPPGPLRHSLHWERGRASFQTSMRPANGGKPHIVSQRVFTVGIPEPGIESIRIALYAFTEGKGSLAPLLRETEVVIDKFEYLP